MIKYKLFAFTLLLVMVFNIFKYQIPYIQYTLFRGYIVKYLCINKNKKNNCCQGKCFLEKQLKLIDENKTTHETNNKKNQNNEVKDFLRSSIYAFHPVGNNSLFYGNSETNELKGFTSPIFEPPKTILYVLV